jgi:hypothetical protein
VDAPQLYTYEPMASIAHLHVSHYRPSDEAVAHRHLFSRTTLGELAAVCQPCITHADVQPKCMISAAHIGRTRCGYFSASSTTMSFSLKLRN